jgi:hypothetical protein
LTVSLTLYSFQPPPPPPVELQPPPPPPPTVQPPAPLPMIKLNLAKKNVPAPVDAPVVTTFPDEEEENEQPVDRKSSTLSMIMAIEEERKREDEEKERKEEELKRRVAEVIVFHKHTNLYNRLKRRGKKVRKYLSPSMRKELYQRRKKNSCISRSIGTLQIR